MPDRTIAQLEAELMQDYYGELPWLDLPTESGYYWYRTVPSRAVYGPCRVRLINGVLLGTVSEGGEKPVEHFQRQWAGPLGRPVPATD